MTTQGTETRQGQDLQGLGAKHDGPFGAADAPQPTDNAETIMTDVQQAVPVAQEDRAREMAHRIIMEFKPNGWQAKEDELYRLILRGFEAVAEEASLPCKSGEGAEFVAGPIWAEAEDECFTAEIQTIGGHNVIATVHGDTRDEAEHRQRAVLAALTPDATQTREAEAWVPRIGDPVKVSDSCEYSADWQRTELWVAGLAVDERCRGVNVTVTEQWPIPHRFVGRNYMGHTDGFLVARTDGKPDDLEPRAALSARDAA